MNEWKLRSRRSKRSRRYRDSSRGGFIDIGTATAAGLCGLSVTIRSVSANPPSLLFQLSLAHGLRTFVRDTNIIEQISDEEKFFWGEE